RPPSAPAGDPGLLRRTAASRRQPPRLAGPLAGRAPDPHRGARRRHQAFALRPALAGRDAPGGHARAGARAPNLRLARRALHRSRRLGLPHAPGGRAGRSRPPHAGRPRPRPPGHRPHRGLLPQARGRGERLNRTLQGRLINELRLAGVTTLAAANAYLWEQFIPDYNATFTRPASDPTSAFVPLGDVDLEQILCEEEDRVVGQDNIVSFDGVHLQLAKQPGRPTCAW